MATLTENKGKEVDLIDFLGVIYKRKLLLLAVVMITLIVAVVFTLFQPKLFKSTVIMMISKPTIKGDFTEKITTQLALEVSLETYQQIIKDPYFLKKVIKELAKHDPNLENFKIEELLSMVKLSAITNTNLLELRVYNKGLNESVLIADTFANILAKEISKLSDVMQTADFIRQRMDIAYTRLEKAGSALQVFKADNKIDYLKSKIDNNVYQIVNTEDACNNMSNGIKTRQEELNQLQSQLAKQKDKLTYNKSILDDQNMNQLGAEVSKEGNKKLWGLKVASEEVNPIYLNLSQRQADLIIEIASNKIEIENLKQSLEKRRKELASSQQQAAQEGYKLANLNREYDQSQETYKILSQKNDELTIIAASAPGAVRIISKAYPPKKPTKPNLQLNLIVALVAGIFLGTFLVFFQEYLSKNA